jgi:hypothetical protein
VRVYYMYFSNYHETEHNDRLRRSLEWPFGACSKIPLYYTSLHSVMSATFTHSAKTEYKRLSMSQFKFKYARCCPPISFAGRLTLTGVGLNVAVGGQHCILKDRCEHAY